MNEWTNPFFWNEYSIDKFIVSAIEVDFSYLNISGYSIYYFCNSWYYSKISVKLLFISC